MFHINIRKLKQTRVSLLHSQHKVPTMLIAGACGGTLQSDDTCMITATAGPLSSSSNSDGDNTMVLDSSVKCDASTTHSSANVDADVNGRADLSLKRKRGFIAVCIGAETMNIHTSMPTSSTMSVDAGATFPTKKVKKK